MADSSLPLYLPELFPTHVRAAGSGISYNVGRFATAVGVFAAGLVFAAVEGSYSRVGAWCGLIYALSASRPYSLEHDAGLATSQIGRFTTFGNLDAAGVGGLADEVERDLEEFPLPDRLAKRYYWRGVRSRLVRDPEAPQTQPQPQPSCVALNSHLRLLPNGDVPVCQFNARKVGNLRRQRFEEIWFGTSAASERAWVRKCPGCWAECEVLPNAIYTGDLLRAVR